MALVSSRIPDSIEKELRWYAEKEKVGVTIAIRKIIEMGVKEARLKDVLEKLREHSITLGKAAELAGISIWDMIDIVKERKIDWVGLTPEIIDRDFEIAMKLSKKIKIK